MSAARDARERLGIAGAFSPDHAASLLGSVFPHRAEAILWLQEQGLIKPVVGAPGRVVVLWSEVHARLNASDPVRMAESTVTLRRA